MDVRDYNEPQDLYVKIAASELSATESGSNKKEVTNVVVATMAGLVLLGLALAGYAWKKYFSRARRQGDLDKVLSKDYIGGGENTDVELLCFSYSQISKLTSNFSINNKLGEGGFGSVYKGVTDANEYIFNLLGHAWRLYKDDKSIHLVGASLPNSSVILEVLWSIHIGLLCVQHHAKDRPTISSVVSMLNNDAVLPEPKSPAFFTEPELEVRPPPKTRELSINNATMSLTGR